FYLILLTPPRFTVFPYTTLFRSIQNGGELILILFKLPLDFALIRHRLVELDGRLATAVTVMFQALLYPGDIGTGFIVSGLGPVKMFGTIVMGFPQRLQ